jgi:V8-like Glu-specific endopeptidase
VDSESERPENAQLMEVSYNVYTSPGQSGSPIFYEAKGEIYMVGIHTSGGEEENRGVLVTSRVREMVNGWIEEMKTIFDISTSGET